MKKNIFLKELQLNLSKMPYFDFSLLFSQIVMEHTLPSFPFVDSISRPTKTFGS